MPGKAQDDDLVMNLVELALARPADERELYVRDACGGDSDLFEQVWRYVQWEERMNGFLLEPFYPASSGEEHPFEPGALLDERFRIIREVAQGGMGIVYEATDEKLDRRIALKCAKAGFRNRLPPEVRNATAISHPNVCRIFEIHTADTSQGSVDFLTMEFLDGETLADRILRAPLSEKEARMLALQLCAGLAEAHRNGVIHGDLKSNNVILCTAPTGEIRAVITDFGLARRPGAAQRAMQSGQLGGTPDYMAPELLKGDKATIASDIYALGVILHELISGRRPMAEEKPGSAHAGWGRILERCLDPDPTRRFRGADEITAALAPRSRRWVLAAAVTAMAVTVGWVSYERAQPPLEPMTLAVLPIEGSGDAATPAANLSRDASAQLERLKGGKRAQLRVVKLADVARRHAGSVVTARGVLGATHVVKGTLRSAEGKLILHAFVTDARTQADIGEREFQYAPGEFRYAARAMAGLVTSTLRLPPPPAVGVNAAAKKDYEAGWAFTRQNSTIDRALPLLESALNSDPDSPLTWAALAEAQWSKYSIGENRAWSLRAEESVKQAQKRDPDSAAVHRVAGLLRRHDGFYEQAEAEYLRAIELEPANSDGYRRLGMLYEAKNQLVQALTAFQKAVELEPTYFKVYQWLGNYYLNRGNSAEAIRQFKQCVRVAPNEPDTHYGLGTAYYDAGQHEEAVLEFRAAIALGETPQALNNLAAVLMNQGKDGEAIPVLVHILEQHPEKYLSWMNLGDAYRRSDQPAKSRGAYRRGLKLAEREVATHPREGVVRARLAYMCARLEDRNRAETETDQALRFTPEDTDARVIAVWTYEALHKREDSLRILQNSPAQVLAEVARRKDLAELRRDSRFQDLIDSRH
ncbi:MAG: tetratricopeptide repeat protein, partial [Candidatus Solibacter sp.]